MALGRNHLLLLCYHAISAGWDAPISLTPSRLRQHLEWLRARRYESVRFTEAATEPVRGRRVAITFDDGCRSVYELARPILDEFGMVATMFVPTDYIGAERPMSWPGIDHYAEGEHADELLPVTWSETRDLAEAGWEIGAHTKSHPRLTTLPDDRLIEELAGSRAACEAQLGLTCSSIAYPYGDVDDRVAAAAAEAGYKAGAALMYSQARETPLSLKRVGMHEPDGRLSFRLKTAKATGVVWRSPAWSAIGWAVARIRG